MGFKGSFYRNYLRMKTKFSITLISVLFVLLFSCKKEVIEDSCIDPIIGFVDGEINPETSHIISEQTFSVDNPLSYDETSKTVKFTSEGVNCVIKLLEVKDGRHPADTDPIIDVFDYCGFVSHPNYLIFEITINNSSFLDTVILNKNLVNIHEYGWDSIKYSPELEAELIRYDNYNSPIHIEDADKPEYIYLNLKNRYSNPIVKFNNVEIFFVDIFNYGKHFDNTHISYYVKKSNS